MKESFGNDIFNYTSLGNRGRHVHLHVVPRYSRPVRFADKDFHDVRWGGNYSPYDKGFKLADVVMEAIKKQIQKSLENVF